jgi:hypothetical protein
VTTPLCKFSQHHTSPHTVSEPSFCTFEQVSFDVVSLTVSAVFTHYHTEDFPLMDGACIRILEGIVNGVCQTIHQQYVMSFAIIPNAPPQSPFVTLPPPLLRQPSTEDVMYKFLTASKQLHQRALSAGVCSSRDAKTHYHPTHSAPLIPANTHNSHNSHPPILPTDPRNARTRALLHTARAASPIHSECSPPHPKSTST